MRSRIVNRITRPRTNTRSAARTATAAIRRLHCRRGAPDSADMAGSLERLEIGRKTSSCVNSIDQRARRFRFRGFSPRVRVRRVFTPAMTTDQPPRLVLKPRRAGPFFNRHPWVFAGAIDRVEGDPVAGDVIDVVSNTGNFVARGLYNPVSRIRARLYSWSNSETLDEAFWRTRIEQAIALRQRLFGGTSAERACRMVFSEADGLSGMTADRYGDYLMIQWTSFALAQRQAVILDALKQTLNPKGIWLRTEKGIGEMEGLEIRDGLLDGEAPPRPLLIEEHGLSYAVDVVEGQKTGYFFDQRDDRKAAAAHVRDGCVLDMFCSTGGFGITAAALGGARDVLCVESSQPALDIASAHARRNGVV